MQIELEEYFQQTLQKHRIIDQRLTPLLSRGQEESYQFHPSAQKITDHWDQRSIHSTRGRGANQKDLLVPALQDPALKIGKRKESSNC
jgi:hypothetical protein